MSVQGRGNASQVLSLVIVILSVLVQFEVGQASTYIVGGTRGWTLRMGNWSTGKNFRDGDVLVFKYNRAYHNVVVVDENGFNSCKTPGGAKVYATGNDHIKLVKGPNYFICNFAGHCESGMKFVIFAH